MREIRGESGRGGEGYPFVLIAVSTSMRKREVLSIRKEDIQLGRRMIYLPKAKAGAREQPITAALAAFLDVYLRESVPADTPWLSPASRRSKSGHTVAIEKPPSVLRWRGLA